MESRRQKLGGHMKEILDALGALDAQVTNEPSSKLVPVKKGMDAIKEALLYFSTKLENMEHKLEEMQAINTNQKMEIEEMHKGMNAQEDALKEVERLKEENSNLKEEISRMKEWQGDQKEKVQEMAGKQDALHTQMEESRAETSKWVEVVKKGPGSSKKETISATLEEQNRRASKARNVVIRGTDAQGSPREDVEKVMGKMGISVAFESAWRVGKDETRSKPLVVRFRGEEDRATFMSRRSALKGTKIYLDDDLTQMQMEQKREAMTQVMAARKEGKWAVYRDGRAVIRDRQTS